MNKIICDVCGTSYPDTAAQCPICGCAKPENAQVQSAQPEESREGTYTYVKGGRFSKSNVRKRNNMAKAVPVYAEEDMEDDESADGSNRGLTIAIIVLLLAILAVAAYIYIRFFMPAAPNDDPAATTTASQTTPEATPDATPDATPESTPEATTTAPETTPATVACTGITLSDSGVNFQAIGDTFTIQATAEPAGCTDPLTFTSSDPKVVTVDGQGKLTAVGEGSAKIVVSCGSVSVECAVNVVLPTEAKVLKFNLVDNEGSIPAGDSFRLKLRDQDKNVMDVSDWSSSDSSIASISKNGTITANKPGTVTIQCTYEGVTYKCTIHVN